MEKTFRKLIGMVLCFALIVGALPLISVEATAANKPWDGTTIDVSWFDVETYEETDTYEIHTPEQLMGLAAIVNGSFNKNITNVIGEEKDPAKQKIVESGEKNVIIIPFDGTRGDVYWGKFDFEGKTFKLMNDLDMGGRYNPISKEWDPNSPNYMPIGGAYCMDNNDPDKTLLKSSFNGNFDGQGHTVKNIYMNRYVPKHFGYSQAMGLIGAVGQRDGGQKVPDKISIKNIIIGEGFFYGRRMLGGVVGRASPTKNGVIIENCINHAEMLATDKKGVGGIVGALWDENGIVRNCYNTGKITNTNSFNAAGIAGELDGGLYNCYNVGEVNSINQGNEIATQTGKGVHANHYYWLKTPNNSGRPGVGSYQKEFEGAGQNQGVKTESEMKTQALVDLLNVGSNAFYYEAGQYPKLLIEKKTSERFKVNITQPAQYGTIRADQVDNIPKGGSVVFYARPNPGYILDKYIVDGQETTQNSLTVLKDISLSGKFRPLKAKAGDFIADNKDYRITVLKNGVVKEGDGFRIVKDYPIKPGDAVYENDLLLATISLKEGSAYAYANLDRTNVISNFYDYETGKYYDKVTGDGVVEFKISSSTKADDWIDKADTKWYDNNPDAKEFEIEDHFQFAGIAKICNDNTSEKYKDEKFAGKTITIKQDIRLRLSQQAGDNVNWVPIEGFQGILDGKGHAIDGFIITRTHANRPTLQANKWGVFAFINKGAGGTLPTVKNLTVRGKIDTKDAWQSQGTMGGLVAEIYDGQILNCVSEIIIENPVYKDYLIGGVVGFAERSTISDTKYRGTIDTLQGIVGGIAGKTSSQSIKNSTNYGSIRFLTQTEVHYNNRIFMGGIVGETTSLIDGCANVGNLIGYNIVGGIAGTTNRQVQNSYHNGPILYIDSLSNVQSIGTIIGRGTSNLGTAINCYSTGKITTASNWDKGIGIIGTTMANPTIQNTYYEEGSLEGGMNNTTVPGATALSESQLKSQATINKLGVSFALDTYHQNNGYPVLKTQNDEMSQYSIEQARSIAMKELEYYVSSEMYTEDHWETIIGIRSTFNNQVVHKSTLKDIRDLLAQAKAQVDKIEKKYVGDESGQKEMYINMLNGVIDSTMTRLTHYQLPKTANNSIAENYINEARQLLESENATSSEIMNQLNKMKNFYDKTLLLDNTPPVILNVGPKTIYVGDTFDPREGVEVYDTYPGAPPPTYNTSGDVNTDMPGEYKITYIVRDSVYNETKVVRTITVREKGQENVYDIDGDGVVNVKDASTLLRLISNGKTEPKHDLNQDGAVNSNDYKFLLKILVNK